MSSVSKILKVCNYFLVVLIGLSSLQCQKEPIDQELYIIYTPTDASNDVEKKYGFINNRGEVIIEPQYDSASPIFSEGLAWVKIGVKYGYIDKSGEMVIEPFKCDNLENFSEGLAAVNIDGKWGYIDKEGEIIIPFKFNGAYRFSEGLAPVLVIGEKAYHYGDFIGAPYGSKFGYINKSGVMVIPPKFDGVGFFKEDFAIVMYDSLINNRRNARTFLIDKSGKSYFEDNSYWYRFLSEGLRAVKLTDDYKWGFMNSKFEIVIKPLYSEVGDFSEGLASVQGEQTDYFYNFIDSTGKIVIKLPISSGREAEPPPFFSEGLARVFIDYKFYFIDKTGKKVFQAPKGYPESFSEGLALLELYDKFGYIDTSGKVLIEPKYEYASNFQNGIANVRIDGINAYINKSGQYIWPKNFKESVREIDRSTPNSFAELYIESLVKNDFKLFNRLRVDSSDVEFLVGQLNNKLIKEIKSNYSDLNRQFENARSRIYFFYREATHRYEGNVFPKNLKYHLKERDTEQEDWGIVYEFNLVLEEVLESKLIRISIVKDSNNEWNCFKDNLNY